VAHVRFSGEGDLIYSCEGDAPGYEVRIPHYPADHWRRWSKRR